MFEAIKIYKGQKLELEETYKALIDLGYKRVGGIAEEGDFSSKGENLFVYPATFEYPIRIELFDNKVEGVKTIDVASYKAISEHNMVMVLPIKGMLRKRKYRPAKAHKEVDPIDTFVDIEPSDYVVHVDYGIGKYLGVERIRTKEGFQDHLVLEYKAGDKLYVPFDDLNKVQKYIAFEKRPPKLYKIGSRTWSQAKERARKGAARVALEILEIQAKRNTLRGVKYSVDTDWQKLMEKSFPYKETEGQKKAVLNVK
ncbi:CarD family transcriptional regulator, partial [Candidatus Omnitrophota bacterium]